MSEQDKIRQPARVIIGHCPCCRAVLVVENEYECWPWVACKCGWQGDTQAIDHRCRYERGIVGVLFNPDVTA